MLYPDGDVYVGQWKAGKREGCGRVFYASDNISEAAFVSGVREGPGTFWEHSGYAQVSNHRHGKKIDEGAEWDPRREASWRLVGGDKRERISLEEAESIAKNLQLTVPAAPPVLQLPKSWVLKLNHLHESLKNVHA